MAILLYIVSAALVALRTSATNCTQLPYHEFSEPAFPVTMGSCFIPAPDGTVCQLGCRQPYTVPVGNLTQNCQNGTWVGGHDVFSLCAVSFHETINRGGLMYSLTFQGNLSSTNEVLSLQPFIFTAPALFNPFGVVVQMILSMVPSGDFFFVAPRCTAQLNDYGAQLGAASLQAPTWNSTVLACYPDGVLETTYFQELGVAVSYTVTPAFYEWFPYQLDVIGNSYPTVTNYVVQLNWIDARLLIGDTREVRVVNEDPTTLFFVVEGDTIDSEQNPLELTFTSTDHTPVVVIVSEQIEGLCSSESASSLYKEIISQTGDFTQYSSLSFKTFTTYGKFILSPTSSPQLHQFDVGKSQGRYSVAVYIPNRSLAMDKNFTLTLSVGPSYDGWSSALAFILLFPAAIVVITSIIAYFRFSKVFCPNCRCRVYPELSGGPARYKTFKDFFASFWLPTARPYSFSWLTCVVGAIFGVTSYQVVIITWLRNVYQGDGDSCFYNEACFRPHWDVAVPLNNLLSNFPYIILGIGWLIYVALNEGLRRAGHDHTTLYALGFALMGEGVFSGLYHICPSPNIFQFDTAFMFLIGSLLIVNIFQSCEIEENHSSPKRFKSAKIFLFFFAPLLIFNYIGTSINSNYTINNPIAYWFFVVLWEILGFVMIFYSLAKSPLSKEEREFHAKRGPIIATLAGPVLTGAVCVLVISLTIANAVLQMVEIASMFLYIVVATALIAVLRIGLVRADTTNGRIWWLALLSFLTSFFWILALHYFSIDVTNKSKPAAISREKNAPCVLFDYFDSHDVWHLLSAIGLTFALILVLNLHPPENESSKPFPELEPFIEPAQKYDDEEGKEGKDEGATSESPGSTAPQSIQLTEQVSSDAPEKD